MEVSKAFRARLQLATPHAELLQSWATNHLAMSCVFCSGHSTILVGLTDRPRSAASFARTLRTISKRLSLPTDKRTLAGHWVTLLTTHEAVRLCTGSDDLFAASSAVSNAPQPQKKQAAETAANDQARQPASPAVAAGARGLHAGGDTSETKTIWLR